MESRESGPRSGLQHVRPGGRRGPGSRDWRGHGPGVDHGTEFTSRALKDWAGGRGVQLDFIRPGKPVENAYLESFNGKLRDECLKTHQFCTLDEAKAIIEAWRRDYNEHRPHGALGHLTPREFAIIRQDSRATEAA